MTYQRLAYTEQDPAPTMSSDCAACRDQLRVPRQHGRAAVAYAAPRGTTPGAGVPVDDATAHLASRMHLHLH